MPALLVLVLVVVLVLVLVVVIMPSPHPWLPEGYVVAVIIKEAEAHAGGKVVTEGLIQGIEAGTPAYEFHSPSFNCLFGVCMCVYVCMCV